MKLIYFLLFLLPFLIFSDISEEKLLRRINYHIVVEDFKSASIEAKEALEKFPLSRDLWISYIHSLAKDGEESLAIDNLRTFASKFDEKKFNAEILEELSWGILNKGIKSTQYSIRLISLVGSYLTNDVRAVKILSSMMRDSNAILRSVALQLVSNYLDEPLKRQVGKLLDEEKVWLVKLEVIQAAGRMRLKEKAPKLKEIIASEKSTFEEKALAIQALINIYDKVSLDEIKPFFKSPKAGLRQFAAEIASYFNLKEAKTEIVSLVNDPIADVKVAALNAIGLSYLDLFSSREIEKIIEVSIKDLDPAVSITACWLGTIANLNIATGKFKVWVFDENPDNRRLAAAALAKCGDKAISLSQEIIKTHKDPYVKANVALGLVGQRKNVKECCNIIYDLLKEKEMWMKDNRKNSLFEVLCPSQLRHIDQIPHYPEAIDQMTRLNLLSILAVMEDPRASDAIKNFLKQKTWGLTGAAAAMLLQEGDEDALQIVRSLLTDPDKTIRVQAALVLAMLGKDETVISVLEAAYKDADRELKLYILEALGHIGNIDSYAFFVDVLNEPFQALRIADASAIVQCLNK
jgi:HEAT repeat protein